MKVAVIGSRNLQVHDLSVYLPSNTTVLIGGGAKGIDTCAECYAEKNNIPFIKICPAYEKYGRVAPLIRNREIVLSADHVLAFWNESTKGTRYVIELCKKLNKPITVYTVSDQTTFPYKKIATETTTNE